jgi:predicted dehydrogenase
MRRVSRRKFLEVGAGAAATLATGKSAARAGDGVAASRRMVRSTEAPAHREDRAPVRVAVMGVNGRGRQLLPSLIEFPEVEITHICDPDSSVIPAAIKLLTDRGRKPPTTVRDFRTVLDDPQLDVLVCSAPDHWHALATILACQAGKDVYVEKPVSHNIVEGRRMVEAARKYNRVVQAGTQRRSSEELALAVQRVRSGRLGKVHLAHTWITSVRPNIGHEPVAAPPAALDFNLWAGPAVDPHYKRNLVPYNWHWRWLYGTGECGNNGIHFLDVARWGLGVDAPQFIACGGRKYHFDDDQETPDTQLATFDFTHAAIEWEHRTWSKRGEEGSAFGVVFYGTEATLVAVDNGWKIYQDRKVVEDHPATGHGEWVRRHIRNFLDCRRTRERPAADIEIGHRSTSLCHLANIAWRTRSTLRFDGPTETIADNLAASAQLSREYRSGFRLPTIT